MPLMSFVSEIELSLQKFLELRNLISGVAYSETNSKKTLVTMCNSTQKWGPLILTLNSPQIWRLTTNSYLTVALLLLCCDLEITSVKLKLMNLFKDSKQLEAYLLPFILTACTPLKLMICFKMPETPTRTGLSTFLMIPS